MPNLWKIMKRKVRKQVERSVVDEFHKLYYSDADETWKKTFWFGVRVFKCPFDLWVYQEILWALRPDIIVETGTAHGGSALYFAPALGRAQCQHHFESGHARHRPTRVSTVGEGGLKWVNGSQGPSDGRRAAGRGRPGRSAHRAAPVPQRGHRGSHRSGQRSAPWRAGAR